MVIAAAAATAASLLPAAAASAAPNASAASVPRAAIVHPAANSAHARPDGGTITAGTSIGTAWPPLQGGTVYSQANSFAGFPEDWYVLYKKPDSNLASITIDNTSSSSTCGIINVSLQDNNGWADAAVNSATLSPGGSTTFTIESSLASDPQGLYYVWVTGNGNDCNSSGSATYTMELAPSAEFGNPSRAPSQAGSPGISIGSAWPPLHGGISYTHTNSFAGFPEDWYVLYKKPDSRIATIRVVNTTVANTGCPFINVSLQDNNGWADGAIGSTTLNANSAVTLTIPASLASDPHGLYYLWITGNGNDCNSSGGASYTIEPEPGTELTSPARVPGQAGHPGTSIGNAWPPLHGGTSYTHTNSFAGFPEDWYVLYKKPDSRTATIRIVNTTVSGTSCPWINVNLYDSHGTADSPVSSATLNANSSSTFAVPAKLAGDAKGQYFLVVQGNGNDCNSFGSANYAVDPEPGAEWGTTSRALPSGPSRKLAGGPLAGGANYAATLPNAGSQEWAFFVTKGAATVRVADTSAASAGCKLDVTAGPSAAALNAGQVAGLRVKKAGRYTLDLAVAGGCKPKSPLSALIELTGAVRGPALTVTDPTLKTGVIKRAYRATITVTGGKKPYAFTAATALPPGLKLTRSTGVISGKPAKAGSYTVMVTITDSARPARNTIIVPVKITIT